MVVVVVVGGRVSPTCMNSATVSELRRRPEGGELAGNAWTSPRLVAALTGLSSLKLVRATLAQQLARADVLDVRVC